MTYLQFHLVFLLPPLLLLAVLLQRTTHQQQTARWPLPLMAAIAFAYTTPWDNYLVYRDVWSYGLDRILFTVGYVPIEEYLFFILQPLLTGAWFYVLLEWQAPSFRRGTRTRARWAGAVLFLLLTLLGAVLLLTAQPEGLYLGLIFVWASPVLAAMWAYGGELLVQSRQLIASSLLPPTLYLWLADWTAMRLGIWHITDATSLGVAPFGMPIEEATFFLLTNLLVIQGLLLFYYGGVIARWHASRPATR